ncbi:MAG TPA: sensor histidine kinase, partial [Flavobacteriales bacterium]|nr:sensor histidine kinase [Flavobacteriales bacterium]
LLSSMRHGRNIRIETHLEHIPIDIQRAIPCGLITNELVTNSFKYAFEHQNEGTIQVEFLKKNGQLHLNFADNGKGFDPQKIEKNSVGLGLVEDLVQQLNGELHISGNSGARFEMA